MRAPTERFRERSTPLDGGDGLDARFNMGEWLAAVLPLTGVLAAAAVVLGTAYWILVGAVR